MNYRQGRLQSALIHSLSQLWQQHRSVYIYIYIYTYTCGILCKCTLGSTTAADVQMCIPTRHRILLIGCLIIYERQLAAAIKRRRGQHGDGRARTADANGIVQGHFPLYSHKMTLKVIERVEKQFFLNVYSTQLLRQIGKVELDGVVII